MSIDNVNNLPRRNQYVASPGQDEFDYTYPVFVDSDLVVEVDGEVQALNTDYTVAGEGDDAGGTITFTTPLAGDEVVTIYSELAIERTTDFGQNGPWSSTSMNDQLDRLTLISQELKDRIGRSIRFPMSAAQSSADLELDPISAYRGKLLGVSEDDELEPVTLTDGAAVSKSILSGLLWPESDEEDTANRTPSAVPNPLVINPFRYGGVGDGVTNDTVAVQAAFDVAAEMPYSVIDLAGRTWLVDPIKLDMSNVLIKNGSLKASSATPAGIGIVYSLAGGADTTVNQALLDAIDTDYTVRTNVANSLENVVFRNVQFVGNANAIRGIWATGFTRGCSIQSCYFSNIDGASIVLNGSWSFSLISNFCEGDGTNGIGLHLGISGNGERSGSVVANAVTMIGNQCSSLANGCIWNFGSGGICSGNIFEQNVGDGLASQSVSGVTFTGNYLESNSGDNLDLGGTNGVDYAEYWTVMGNHFATNSGNNIRLDAVVNSRIGPNNFSGTVTQHYIIPTSGGVRVLKNELWVPAVNSTYITNSSELDTTLNYLYLSEGSPLQFSAPKIVARSSLESHGSLFVASGGTIDAAAIAQFDSTSKALVIPRMTTAQMDAISSPPDGAILYDTTTDKLMVRANGAWVAVH